MIEPWFDGSLYGWIPGTVLGVVGGLTGGLIGTLASLGRARRFVLSLWGLMLGSSLVQLIVGLYALYCGQPYGIWYALLLPGVLGTVIFGLNLLVILKLYREAEERRLIARDL